MLAGAGLLGLILVVCYLSQSFSYERTKGRPIVEFFSVSLVACLISLLGLLLGLRIVGNRKRVFGVIIFFAVVLRLAFVFTNPILEIDYYRYLWDGIAANNGVSPYKFSPETVLGGNLDDPQLEKLQQLIEEQPTLKTVVSRIHYPQYTTLYPPVSQWVFRITTFLVPDHVSAEWHFVAIKIALSIIDLGTVLCLAWMISFLGKHPAWLIAYAWNPLVLKEIANGGHLDSIAIFFMTFGLGVFFWGLARTRMKSQTDVGFFESNDFKLLWWAPLSGALLALGIGAKLFPVILMPAVLFYLFVKSRWVELVLLGASCALVGYVVLSPMFEKNEDPKVAQTEDEEFVLEIVVAQAQDSSASRNEDGLTAFMSTWRMNDAIFSFVYQNVEYDYDPDKPVPWYVRVPNKERQEWYKRPVPSSSPGGRDDFRITLGGLDVIVGNPAYFIARLVTVVLFGLFYLCVLYKFVKNSIVEESQSRTQSVEDLAGWLFLIMGVFFFLQPTQNPWYWVWAMPLVCFAKNRGWLFVSMILFTYYLRFWFRERGQSHELWGQTYKGIDLFDHCIGWVEFSTVLAVLLIGFIIQKTKQLKSSSAPAASNLL